MQTYIQCFRENENIYYLNKAGRELVGCEKVITKTPHFHHTLMRNDVYIYFRCPKIWQNEFKIPNPEFTIIPDAIFNSKGTQYFLEVDNLQKMKKNKEKLEKYKRFKDMNLWQKKNMGRFPVVLFYTEKDSRKAQIHLNNPGIELIVYTKEDLTL